MVARLVGGYALGARLGRGPTGSVYAARYQSKGCPVAIKVFHDGVVTSADAFHADASRIFALEHPNLVRLLDFGHDKQLAKYFAVSELCPGTALGEHLKKRGRCDELEARRIASAVASGLAAAHAHRVVHRGLAPANVMLAADGSVRVLDFRIAAAPGWPTAPPIYVAPEAKAWQAIGPAEDLWAIGALLVELLSARPPVRPLMLPPCSGELVITIRSCLARDPNLRPWSMAAVARVLAVEPVDLPTARYVRAS